MSTLSAFLSRGRKAQAAVDREVKPTKSPVPDMAVQKLSLVSALDSAINVVVETRALVRKHPKSFSVADRERLALILRQMGQVCYQVSTEMEGGAK